jgi:hypothetical protein
MLATALEIMWDQIHGVDGRPVRLPSTVEAHVIAAIERALAAELPDMRDWATLWDLPAVCRQPWEPGVRHSVGVAVHGSWERAAIGGLIQAIGGADHAVALGSGCDGRGAWWFPDAALGLMAEAVEMSPSAHFPAGPGVGTNSAVEALLDTLTRLCGCQPEPVWIRSRVWWGLSPGWQLASCPPIIAAAFQRSARPVHMSSSLVPAGTPPLGIPHGVLPAVAECPFPDALHRVQAATTMAGMLTAVDAIPLHDRWRLLCGPRRHTVVQGLERLLHHAMQACMASGLRVVGQRSYLQVPDAPYEPTPLARVGEREDHFAVHAGIAMSILTLLGVLPPTAGGGIGGYRYRNFAWPVAGYMGIRDLLEAAWPRWCEDFMVLDAALVDAIAAAEQRGLASDAGI